MYVKEAGPRLPCYAAYSYTCVRAPLKLHVPYDGAAPGRIEPAVLALYACVRF